MKNDRSFDLFPWVAVFLVTAAFGGVYFFSRLDPKASPLIVKSLAEALPIEAAPISRSATKQIDPPQKKIWECDNAGQRTFSDSPCGANAVVRQFAPVNSMEATAPLPASYQNQSVGGYPRNTYDAPGTDATINNYECQSLKEAVDAIHERMRHRYSNPEGNFYRGRLHDISDQQYELHCLR